MIDLDLLPAEPPPPALPGSTRRRRLVAVVLVAVVFLVAGATPPRSYRATLMLALHASTEATYQVIGDTCYIAEANGSGSVVTAYPLAGGSPRWSVRLDAVAGSLGLSGLGDTLLVSSFLTEPLVYTHVTALDRDTGAVRWDNTLAPDGIDTTRGLVLLDNRVQTDRIDAMPDGNVVAVAADTGRPRWTYHWPAGCQIDLAEPGPDRTGTLAVLCADGTLIAVDLATGQVRATTHGAFQLPEGYLSIGVYVLNLAGLILVSNPVTDGTTFAAFDPGDLTRRWTITLPTDRYTPVPCGMRLCIAASSGTAVLDAATGQVVWRLGPGGFISAPTDRYLISVDKAGQVTALDAGTGRVILRLLTNWALTFSDEGRPLLLRQDPARHRTWVATLDGDPLALRLMSWLPGAVDAADCTSTAGYLICRTVNQTMQVWRLDQPGRHDR